MFQWVEDVRQKVVSWDNKPIPIILLANKCDLNKFCIENSTISEFCRQQNIDAWFETSAKNDINIGMLNSSIWGDIETVGELT